MIYGNAVVIDGSDIALQNTIDGTELQLDSGLDGGEVGVYYDTGGGGGDYPHLSHKPSINGITIIGDKTGTDYRLQNLMGEITPQDIDDLIYGGNLNYG